MKTLLIIVTLVEVALLVVVLAGYLIAIATTLRRVSKTLGLVTFGVRAIEKQTEPIGPTLREINGALEKVAAALAQAAGVEAGATAGGTGTGETPPGTEPAETSTGITPETSGGTQSPNR